MPNQVRKKVTAGLLTRLFKRWLLKSLAFTVLTALVLNPNLKRAYMQVRHTLEPESLIQTNFAALPSINAQIDQFLADHANGESEARGVAQFVLREIQYVSDYENWGNVEYWPTAEETWQRQREDCDGRAILATSILRSRGFPSARLVVGLDHMWIRVNENERDPSAPVRWVSLLNARSDSSREVEERMPAGDLWQLAQALLNPTALRETSTQIVAEIPALRKAVLAGIFLLLCCPVGWMSRTRKPGETLSRGPSASGVEPVQSNSPR